MTGKWPVKAKLLGNIDVWLCDYFQPRRCTKAELAVSRKYIALIIKELGANVPYNETDHGLKLVKK